MYLTEFFGAVNPVALSPGNWLKLNLSMEAKPESASSRSQIDPIATDLAVARDEFQSTDFTVTFNPGMISVVGGGILLFLLGLSLVF